MLRTWLFCGQCADFETVVITNRICSDSRSAKDPSEDLSPITGFGGSRFPCVKTTMKPALFLAILVAAIPQKRKHLEGTDDLEFPVELVKSLFQLFRISKPQDVIVAGH